MNFNKIFIILIVLFLIIVFAVYILFLNIKKERVALATYNYEYEKYLNIEISGTDLATLINKTININEKNKLKKDKNNHYIENDENSIKIIIKISVTDKDYNMEEFFNNDISDFVKYFSQEKFKCTNIEYHEKTGKVKNIKFEQV